MDMLLNPSFAKDPPVKLDVSAKMLGLVCAILGGIGAFFGLIVLLGISGFAMVVGTGAVWVIGSLVNLIGEGLFAWGGYRMYQGDRDGKRLVIYGLVANAVGSLVAALGSLDLLGWIVNAAILFVIYYLVIISRFEGEPKLVTSTAPPAERRGPPAP